MSQVLFGILMKEDVFWDQG